MTRSTRRLVNVAASVLGVIAILWFFFGSIGAPDETDLLESSSAGEPVALEDAPTSEVPEGVIEAPDGPDLAPTIPTPSSDPASLGAGADERPRRYVNYAIGLHELQGLAPDTPPGTRLELWAAWDPPIVKEPRVQQLIDELILEKVIPPTLPEGPHVALLSLRPRDVPDLLWGDQWGRLNVVMLPELNQ